MRYRLLLFSSIIILLNTQLSFAQRTLLDYGIREYEYFHTETDTVRYWVQSLKGEENISKPLFIFCQGSLPRPMAVKDDKGNVNVFVFPFLVEKEFLEKVHLLVIGKPGVPTISEKQYLDEQYNFLENGVFPEVFVKNDHLKYYVSRNLGLLNHLKNEKWIDSNKIIVGGHSQGSHIALKTAVNSNSVTHLIYSGGSPFGRIMRTIEQNRNLEGDSSLVDGLFDYWKEVMANPDKDISPSGGDTYLNEYSFNELQYEEILKLNIPVLVTYGTKDESHIFNDFLRIEAIRRQKKNIAFIPYLGTEHNFFPVDDQGNVNRNVFNWDKVAQDWYKWIFDL